MDDDLIRRGDAIDAVIAEGRTVDSHYLESERIIHVDDAVEAISMLPSAQPRQTCEYWDSESNFCALCRPSAQRKGKWMFSPDHAEGICTNCHYKIYGRPYQNTYLIVPYNYCPNCGAEMRGEDDDADVNTR